MNNLHFIFEALDIFISLWVLTQKGFCTVVVNLARLGTVV